ncbi:dolichol-phosphate mannosyltransferase [Desulfobaculum xiamenense]|uniref:Dolichol-phosphate mannosyltransferase n=1 Tax=Desulfobaculum xiamenense TaxID=995050 RepID=A0A846QU41_9BACT|nr:glycosyltransferase family 2 protein [Desulfobaculum xiamenense]NJB68674.1 dolichol-phosphate mannosyltransferase [Desulfobaculum xiamenense]
MKTKLAIVVPVFNEAESLELLHAKVREVFETMPGYDWELLFVNDGSADRSWEVIETLSRRDTRVSGLNLSRNFGKEMALTAGVSAMNGSEAVLFMDADLQHPPDLIPRFVHEWENGADIVVGIRKACRDYSLIKRLGSRGFYFLMSRLSDVEIPPNGTDFRLIDRGVVETLCTFTERTRMFRGIIDWMGFRKSLVEFEAPDRCSGRPTYSLRKLVRLAVNSLTSFSLAPLRFTGYLGVFIIFIAAALLSYMVLTDVFFDVLYTPIAYVLVLNTFLVGVILAALGMIALYIGHIHTEVVGRPLFIVREACGRLAGDEGEHSGRRVGICDSIDDARRSAHA